MNYVQAIEQATLGNAVMRPHWCFVKLVYDPKELKSFIVDIDDNTGAKIPRVRYKPNTDDLRANDWIIVTNGATDQ